MKVVGRPVELRIEASVPGALRLRGRWRPIRQILDRWRETGRWWEGEQEKEFLRVEADGVYVLCRPCSACRPKAPSQSSAVEEWFLWGAED
ncbi:MAG: hypothetical protein N2512_05670 [Armatimonadetes bacterium]|nr:hypothetical protein [Armatimonadota bacterium]